MYVWETSSTATEHNAHLFLAETWEKSTYLELLLLVVEVAVAFSGWRHVCSVVS